MTGGHLIPLLAVLGAVVLLNLAITWALVRWNRDPAELLGSARYAPENAPVHPDSDDGGTAGADRDDGSGGGGGDSTGPTGEAEPTTLRTSAGTELRLSGPGADGEDDPPPLAAAGEAVVCRHCGAENRPGYRYCRWCVRSGFADDESGVAAGATTTDRPL